ncbi:hypothetical protein K503DRAFT_777216 [Rhizopogon vinicolor AM-OR11-026]|uniref:Major facilitator superfamily (MFS) profile domain-containing protein n=1 Tax=Rhizopogon vinicolor AM-OR11-026 TaxID=1314800 RepID=A0A1B7MGZ7_9AGAM|nr:hypothetical protein K503DRAFT_777216 [Rhizopogon vinicolor AM-OR11-026]
MGRYHNRIIIGVVYSAIVAPAAGQVAFSFGVTINVMISLTTSIFVLAYVIGPLFLGPMSEICGQSRVLQLSGLWCLIRNLACGFARIESQLLAFLFLAGLGASASMQIGRSVVGDCWRPE